MRYLSPRAYEYLRHKFCDNLPHSDTIRKWFSINKTGTNGGLINGAFETLSNISEKLKKEGKELYVSVTFDEIYSFYIEFFSKKYFFVNKLKYKGPNIWIYGRNGCVYRWPVIAWTAHYTVSTINWIRWYEI